MGGGGGSAPIAGFVSLKEDLDVLKFWPQGN